MLQPKLASPRLEKASELRRRLLLADPTQNFRLVMAGRLRKKAWAVDDAATLRVFSTEAKSFDPRQRNGRSAHGTRFERHPQGTAIEPRLSQAGRSMTDSDHFGMSGGIEVAAHGVSCLGDDLVTQRDDSADRHLPCLGGNGG